MRALYDEAARLAGLHGFRYIETPAIEHTELFARTAGESSDVVQKEMYTFEDRGGRSITLRPEGTAPIVRTYLANTHDLPSPFKAYYVASMWRHGRPQAGRYREFRHFGIEVIGSPEPAADLEVITVGDRFLRGRRLARLDLRVNSIGDEVCRPAYLEELVAYLEIHRARLRDEHREHFRVNPMRVLDCKDEGCRGVARDAPKISDRLCGPCKDHFEALLEGLRSEGIAYTHDPLLVRGLDYYTRTAFEFVSHVLSPAQATLCGGGRYDGLAGALGGPPTPGVGFGLGLERVLLAADEEGVALPEAAAVDCFVVVVGARAASAAASIVRSLREAGIATSTSFEPRSLKAQLRMADRYDARFAVIVGDREAIAGTVTLRRLSDGRQDELGLDEAILRIRTRPEEPA